MTEVGLDGQRSGLSRLNVLDLVWLAIKDWLERQILGRPACGDFEVCVISSFCRLSSAAYQQLNAAG